VPTRQRHEAARMSADQGIIGRESHRVEDRPALIQGQKSQIFSEEVAENWRQGVSLDKRKASEEMRGIKQ
jgi:hypothetical protein